jgi:DNA-binding GntR family transcriptional regulator
MKQGGLEPLQRRRISAGDIAYEDVKRAILDGRIPPGEALVEENLAEQLQVSRTPLREALQRLVADELVLRLSNGRLQVAPLSVQQVRELFDVRAALEGLVAKQAATQVTPDACEQLRRVTQAIEAAARDGRTEAVSLHGEEFHTILYGLSGNRYVTRLLTQLKDQIRRYRRIGPVVDAQRALQAAKEHRYLFELIASGKADEVETAMRFHIAASLSAVVAALSKLLENGSSQEE